VITIKKPSNIDVGHPDSKAKPNKAANAEEPTKKYTGKALVVQSNQPSPIIERKQLKKTLPITPPASIKSRSTRTTDSLSKNKQERVDDFIKELGDKTKPLTRFINEGKVDEFVKRAKILYENYRKLGGSEGVKDLILSFLPQEIVRHATAEQEIEIVKIFERENHFSNKNGKFNQSETHHLGTYGKSY